VTEICDDIAAFLPDAVQDPDWADALRSFWVDNPGFIGLTRARAVSYWNEYCRRRIPNFADYPAARALVALDRLAHQPTFADREAPVVEPVEPFIAGRDREKKTIVGERQAPPTDLVQPVRKTAVCDEC
jgi:hypothetical protein